MAVPTVERQYYNTTRKASTVATYTGALQGGVQKIDQLYTAQQQAKIASSIEEANMNIDTKFKELSPKYDNNPDNPEFKQLMDSYRKEQYSLARDNVSPLFRGDFDRATRDNDIRLNKNFSDWQISQRKANASSDVKKLSQNLIDNAYLIGQSENGDYNSAMQKFENTVATIRNVSVPTLGARATNDGIEELERDYLTAFVQGSIEKNPFEAAKALDKDKNLPQKIGLKNVEKLKKYAYAQQKKKQKAFISEFMKNFSENPTKEGLEMLKNQDIVKISEKRMSDLEDMYNASPNYVCETSAEALSSIKKKIDEFASRDYLFKEGNHKGELDVNKQFEDGIELAKYIMNQNVDDSILSDDDRSEYMKQVARIIRDSEYKNLIAQTKPDFDEFLNSWEAVVTAPTVFPKFVMDVFDSRPSLSEFDKKMGNEIIKYSVNTAMSKIEDGDIDGARQILKIGSRQIIDLKYPEVRGKNIGEEFIKDGVVYELRDIVGQKIITHIVE